MILRKYIIVMGGYVARTCSYVLAEGYMLSGSEVYGYNPETGEEHIISNHDLEDPAYISFSDAKDQDYVMYTEVDNSELKNNQVQVTSDVRAALLHPQDEHERKVALYTLAEIEDDPKLDVWGYDRVPDYLYTTVINHLDELTKYFTTVI